MKKENFTGFFLIGFLALGLVSSLIAFVPALRSMKPFSSSEFLKGKPAEDFETAFDENLPHYTSSVDLWGRAGYKIFGEGHDGVLVGQDGWLFSTEEFDHAESFENHIAANIDYIASVHVSLTSQKINLLVIPVPSKARVYESQLATYNFPSYWRSRYQDFTKSLEQRKIPYMNLLFSFFRAKDKTPLYLKTDTHWSPDGARLAAQAIAARVDSVFPYLSFPREEFTIAVKGQEEYKGDLMRFITQGDAGIKPDTIRTFALESANDDLFGDKTLPIALVGTSYSANSKWAFESFLKEAMQADLLNVSDEGLGPFEVMQNYLDSESFKKRPPSLVLWEIPERYLPIVYDLKKP
jgi:alginate O-acetyltransferase complex protein AlgJ